MTTEEIRQKYLALHNALGSRKDAEDKELFDQQHTEIWRNCDLELRTRKATLEAKATLTLEKQQELKELEVMFPTPPELTADELRAKEILSHPLDTIAQSELLELVKIFGNRLGY